MRPNRLLLVAIASALPLASTAAQEREALRVFLDCQSVFCDFDHLRREIAFVNWVRDREVAEIHVLAVSQGTGGGGREVTLNLVGRGRFVGRVDTLQFVTNTTDTDAEVRDALTRMLALGLVRYAVGTPIADRIAISYDAPGTDAPAGPTDDSWNLWVFGISAGGSARVEQRRRNYSVNGRFNARRVTEQWKVFMQVRGSYRRNETVLDSLDDSFQPITDPATGDTLTRTRVDEFRNYGFFGQSVWSVGPHWSLGGRVNLGSSLFSNEKLTVEAGPAIQFSVFPYVESTRRSLTLLYSVGVGYFNWDSVTIFGRESETRPVHRLEIGVGAQQPWGNVFGRVDASQFLDNLAQHGIDVFGGFSIRLFRGLRVNLSGSVARVKNQINLAAGGLSAEDVLVQRRELGTEFRYRTNVSFSYTFGSIFNNIVNPRF